MLTFKPGVNIFRSVSAFSMCWFAIFNILRFWCNGWYLFSVCCFWLYKRTIGTFFCFTLSFYSNIQNLKQGIGNIRKKHHYWFNIWYYIQHLVRTNMTMIFSFLPQDALVIFGLPIKAWLLTWQLLWRIEKENQYLTLDKGPKNCSILDLFWESWKQIYILNAFNTKC